LTIAIAMPGIFRLINPAPLLIAVRSRECCTYLFRAMKFVGWIPPDRGLQRTIYLLWSCLTCGFIALYVPVGFLLSIVKDFKSIAPEEIFGVLQIAFNVTGETAKITILLIFLSRLHDVRSVLDTLDGQLLGDEDRRKIHKAVANSNFVFLVYLMVYMGYPGFASLAGMINSRPPFLIYNPLFDWRDGVSLFWLQSMLEICIMSMAVMMGLILDTYTLVFIIILRAHLDILKDHIRKLCVDSLKTEAEHYEDLVGCIVYHRGILRGCTLLRPAISGTIFVQFLLIGVVLGLTLINVLYFCGVVRSISSIIFFIAALLETFPFCYLCDLLVEDSRELSNLLGQSHWIDAQPKYKSTLRIFMLHLQKPIIFIAGGIFPISIKTNIQVNYF
ncbi:hypothetical protein KR222_004506, partial [Zaprionus bogoriensis]